MATNTTRTTCVHDKTVCATAYKKQNPGQDVKIQLIVKLFELNYGEGKYLEWEISSDVGLDENFYCHPFIRFDFTVEKDEKTGLYTAQNIVAKNEVILTLIKYISMPEDELQLVCGNTAVPDYKSQLIETLANLWD